ncbi:MAG: nitronate monooxygenase, partial [Lachnospiraceae bacterium]
MEFLKIGDKSLLYPIIQGGMGVGISLSSLAAHVAGNGGMGIISTAQIGFREDDFYKNPIEANLRAVKTELQKARDIAAEVFEKRFKVSKQASKFLEKLKNYNPFIGFNIMVATNKYADYVIEAVKAGADIIISGAGLPIELPELVAKGQALSENAKKTCIAPIVSSRKSAKVILKMWDRKYNTTADAVVIEGPLAGGHLGFSYDELHELGADTMASKNYKREKYDVEIKDIIEEVKIYEEKFGKKIPVFVAGGIYTKEDMDHAISLGADGVQMGTRFVTTYE